jgi:hypothetical protein
MKLICRFGSDEEVKAAAVQWFQKQPREFSAESIHRLLTA